MNLHNCCCLLICWQRDVKLCLYLTFVQHLIQPFLTESLKSRLRHFGCKGSPLPRFHSDPNKFCANSCVCRSAMPAVPQTLPPDTFEITNKLLEKCYEYYKVKSAVLPYIKAP